jgi:hypothetical protein
MAGMYTTYLDREEDEGKLRSVFVRRYLCRGELGDILGAMPSKLSIDVEEDKLVDDGTDYCAKMLVNELECYVTIKYLGGRVENTSALLTG